MKWEARFVECGGYDCMSDAWVVFDASSSTITAFQDYICVLDMAHYRDNPEQAEINAKAIAGLHP